MDLYKQDESESLSTRAQAAVNAAWGFMVALWPVLVVLVLAILLSMV